MPLPLPNLDDHDYADLVEMARSLIPSEYPEWTDHNPSDTGIILLELFAWLTELLLYQVNQVPDQSQEEFLKLLKGYATWTMPPNQSLQAATQKTILALRKRYRAVTAADYEALVMENFAVGRVKVFENRNLTLKSQPPEPVAGHISLVVVPQEPFTVLNPSLQTKIRDFLEERRLLGTKQHVVSPEYVNISIKANLNLEAGRVFEQVKAAGVAQLQQFFHPLSGGEDKQGWPFGRAVYISEIYQQLDQLDGVDYVEDVTVTVKPPGQNKVSLKAHQLVQLDQVEFTHAGTHN
ncbi:MULTISPECIES: baseplate J/gp47 family protein [Cyanophyceae]|uniref:Baseplate J/gp47 family protein n=1 Tax=Leptolyngbya subtilissima DQ-A4 TaxID=2933933 RepID=A0ABV0JZK4_9CYAN|nr:baseplate J/gp47 family protein [Nodosilinea sp. FACHB-141]MBD2112584.1 baseplate J/gp47 family protein [Nodosilinea sp. FACHB-141]